MALVIAQMWRLAGFVHRGNRALAIVTRKELRVRKWALDSIAGRRAAGDGFHQLMRLSGLGLIVRRVARIRRGRIIVASVIVAAMPPPALAHHEPGIILLAWSGHFCRNATVAHCVLSVSRHPPGNDDADLCGFQSAGRADFLS